MAIQYKKNKIKNSHSIPPLCGKNKSVFTNLDNRIINIGIINT